MMCDSFRVGKVALVMWGWLVLGSAWGSSCPEFAQIQILQGDTTFDIATIGQAYFGSFNYNGQAGTLELYDGVCIVGQQNAWLLAAPSLYGNLKGDVKGDIKLAAADVSMLWAGWQIQATHLETLGDYLILNNALIRSEHQAYDVQALKVLYNLTTNHLELVDVAATSSRFRISGAKAYLKDTFIYFEDAIATTCVCGDEFYVINAPNLSYDQLQESIVIYDGRLIIGDSTEIALAQETQLTSQSQEVEFPVKIQYIADNVEENIEGTGLELLLSNVTLTPHSQLDLGVMGLDGAHEFDFITLLELHSDNLSATLGKARQGLQADAEVFQSLPAGFRIAGGTQNRHWAAEDYLHEAYIKLTNEQYLPILKDETITFQTQALVAYSQQGLEPQPISDARFALTSQVSYDSSFQLGTLNLKSTASLSYYPQHQAWQYGLRLMPVWKYQQGAISFSLSYDYQLTNSASPFSTKLDRSSPSNLLNAQMSYQKAFDASSYQAAFGTELDFTKDNNTNQAVLRKLTWALGLTQSLGLQEFTLTSYLKGDAAALVAGVEDSKLRAYIEAGVKGQYHDWLVSLRGKYDWGEGGEVLELGLGIPLNLGDVTLKPYLALNTAPLFLGSGPLELSAHGLEVSWDGCCGNLEAFYHFQDATLNTGFKVNF